MKLKVKLECERIVEVLPEHYPPNSTREDIIRIEKESAINDPFLFIDCANTIKATVDIFEDDI